MYHFMALFSNRYEYALNDRPVTIEIVIDSLPFDNMTARDAWKWAIDKAFEYQKKHDNLSFDTMQLLFID